MPEILCKYKISLMRKAVEKYGNGISMCGKAQTWDECFTIANSRIIFWFNVGKFSYTTTMEVIE